MRRHLRRQVAGDSGSRLRLSFIDITAGGFGAAAFLAVILFAMPLTSSSGRKGSEQFIHLMVAWEDENVLMELIVHTPAGETIRLAEDQGTGSAINPFTGEVNASSKAWEAVLVTGDSHFGDNSIVGGDGYRHLSLRIVAPCPAEPGARGWAFDLGVRKTLKVGTRIDQLDVPYKADLYTADSEAAGGPWEAEGIGGIATRLRGSDDLLGCLSPSRCPEGQSGVELHWRGPGEERGTRHRDVPVLARDADNLSHCGT